MVSLGQLFTNLLTLININFFTKTQSDNRYIQKSNTSGLMKNDGTVDTSTYLTSHQSITGKEDTSNKRTSSTGFNNTLSDSSYCSEKLIKEYVDDLIGDIDDYIER